jgi:REP-associated tyrosine transposase
MKPRLRRLDRVFVGHPIYFITACTHDRRPLLATTAAHEAFVKFAEQGAGRGAWVGRYVLMPDHLHLFAAFDDRQMTLSSWMKSLKNSLSKTFRAAGRDAPHWQKGFFDHVLRSSESASEKWSYVRENPVRAGLVSRAEDWPFAGEITPLDADFGRL